MTILETLEEIRQEPEFERYFDVHREDDIRIKGTRIGLEHLLYEAIHRAQTPKQIAERFHTVTLEQVYATLMFYERHKGFAEAYVTDYLEWCRKAREEFWADPPPVVEKLRKLKAEMDAKKTLEEAAT
ncbi:MAG: DUF433 domain-containing protein [Candidatus Poribacteria bacterium]|nr:DUF433 domain-containing protein [Candidatus Poribacteria bacterium]